MDADKMIFSTSVLEANNFWRNSTVEVWTMQECVLGVRVYFREILSFNRCLRANCSEAVMPKLMRQVHL